MISRYLLLSLSILSCKILSPFFNSWIIALTFDRYKGEYRLFTIAVTKEGLIEQWLLPEEYDPAIYERTSNYNFNELKQIIYQEDIDEYIDKFHKDVEEELERMKEEDNHEGLTLQEKWEIDDKLLDSIVNK